jgi:hypothetical protein
MDRLPITDADESYSRVDDDLNEQVAATIVASRLDVASRSSTTTRTTASSPSWTLRGWLNTRSEAPHEPQGHQRRVSPVARVDG